MAKHRASILSEVKLHLTRLGATLLLLAAAFMPVAATLAAPATTTYSWQPKSGEGLDGFFNDPAHWLPAAVPSATNVANVAAGTATVSLPAGEYDTLASLKLSVNTAGTLTFDGSQTVFRQISSADENYTDEPFSIQRSGSHFFNLQTYNTSSTTRYKTAPTTISNGLIRLVRPSSGLAVRLDFESGSYNFYDADGVKKCSDRVMMISRNDLSGLGVEYNFHPGTSFRFPIFRVLSNHLHGNGSTFNFLGGRHEIFGALEMPTSEGYSSRNSFTEFNITNGASLTVHGNAQFGAKAISPYNDDSDYAMGRRYGINVSKGGTLTFSNTVNNATCGRLEMNVGDGGALAFDGTSALIGGQNSTSVVTVARGGRISGTLSLGGPNGRAELLVDGGTADFERLDIGMDATAETSVVATNGAQVSVGTLSVRNATLDLPDGIALTNRSAVRVGHECSTMARMIVREGATLRALHQLDVGCQNGEGTLDILGGTVWQRNPNDNNVYMYLGNKEGSTGTVNLVSGLLKARLLRIAQKGRGTLNVSGGTCEIEDSTYVGMCDSPTYLDTAVGTLNVSGGRLVVGNGTYVGNLGIGNGGTGDMNVSGGEVDTLYIFMGQTGRDGAGWATLRQTGGTIRTRVASYRDDVGVKLADANGRNCRIFLDGGVLRTHRIFGNKSRAAGGTGYAALYANGGTLAPPFACAGLIDLLDEAKLGPNGLTVQSDYACGIPQSFEDADDAPGEGLLVLAGSGVKTITATNSTVARLVVADGTVRFLPNTSGMQAVQHSAITVTNNATLSLVGEQTSLTVRSLVLGDATSDGRIALDLGDVIRVEGALTVNSGTLEVPGSIANGEYGFIELDGDRSAELAAAMERLFVTPSAIAAGQGFSFRTEYDGNTGKTSVKIVVEDLSETSTTAWRGPGDEWATAANWSDGAPTPSKIAVFDSESAPANVAVGGRQFVGGMVFNAEQGYVVSGGLIDVQSAIGARLDATQGVHVVDSSMVLPEGLPAMVESGASLTLGGCLHAGDLVKKGAGRLTVTNDTNIIGDVTVTGGTFAVSSPGALGGAQTVTLKAGALELGGAEGEDTFYDQTVAFASPVTVTNTLMLRVKQDVTLKDFSVSTGLPYKDGPGRLTLKTSSNGKYLSVSDGDANDWFPGKNQQSVVSFDADGLVTDETVLSGLTVAEGEIALHGTAGDVRFISTHYMAIGVPGVTNTAAAPAFSVDHARLQNTSKHFLLGAGLNADNSNVNDIYVTATNGAHLDCNTFYVARKSSRPGVTYHVLADASKISSSWRTHANCNSGAGSTAEFLFRNGSQFLVGQSLNLPYRSTFTFDDSILARDSSLNLASITYRQDYNSGNYVRAGADFTFRNGSTLYLECGMIDVNSSQADPTTFTFDGSEWVPVVNDDCIFVYAYPAKVGIRTANAGLILTVPESCTWTMGQAVTGTGGLVKRGEGTLVFDTHKVVSGGATNDYATATTTLDFTGTLAVEAGKVVVRAGAAAEGAKFALAAGAELDLDGGTIELGAISGTGTVKNGTVTGTIPLTLGSDWSVAEDLVTFDASTVAFGRVTVDLGRTAENPVARPFGTVTVGRYSGDVPPSLSGWRVKGTGIAGLSGRFTAVDGEIRMTLCINGLIMSVY